MQIKIQYPHLYAEGIEGITMRVPFLNLKDFKYTHTKILFQQNINSDFVVITAQINEVKYGFLSKIIANEPIIAEIKERVKILPSGESQVLADPITYSDAIFIKALRIYDEIKYRIGIQNNAQARRMFTMQYGEMPFASEKSNENVKIKFIKRISIYPIFCLSIPVQEKERLLFSCKVEDRIESILKVLINSNKGEIIEMFQSKGFKNELTLLLGLIIGLIAFVLFRKYY